MLREINSYYNRLEEYRHYSDNEQSIRDAFKLLLNSYAVDRDLLLISELAFNRANIPDGTIKDKFRFDFGYWEAKDSKDDLDFEIAKKLKKGYPSDNIIFEDSQRAVLYQNRELVLDIDMQNPDKLKELLDTFFAYEKPEILEFNRALEQFKNDIPNIIKPINIKIEFSYQNSAKFKKVYLEFLEICQNSIDENISRIDIFEMLLQHILTEDIFKVIFNDSDFHLHNNIAKKLNELESSLFDRAEKKNLFANIRYYYEAIKSHSLALSDYIEKQKFLNTLYENFYKAYNPKRADKLGIVYTPLEIVDFMIESTDSLLYKHFNKTLSSKGVKILDPATGTGTFLTRIIDKTPKQFLEHKFKNELFANEISILPYYIANLNLEYIYQQKMGNYSDFENISFTDTLELNKNRKGQGDLFSFNDENTERIDRQEASKIDIIIGNPPYNANQQSENDNNKNRTYSQIDARIKESYVKHSNAQKTKVYDMYSRFYRWASDRIDEGIISFITNSSFIDSKSFDGFRKSLFDEFNEIYIIDLGGNVRKNEQDGNVFDIMIGVAILILVKKPSLGKCKLNYFKPKVVGKIAKLEYLKNRKFNEIDFEMITPDKRHNWLNQSDNDWEELIPIGTKECKADKKENAIFRLYSNGVVTARDEWVYDFNRKNLEKKVRFCVSEYKKYLTDFKRDKSIDVNSFVHSKNSIKWTRDLKKQLSNKKVIKFDKDKIYKSLYRPFVNKHLYFEKDLNEMQYQQNLIFPMAESDNLIIGTLSLNSRQPFSSLISKFIIDTNFTGEPFQSFPLHTYQNEQKIENITNFGLKAFQTHYKNESITKRDIFNYCYGVLHSPKYREKYEINLKQDLPRIPFYKNFDKFVEVGARLIELHSDFENIEEYPLREYKQKSQKPNIAKLKLSKDKEEILIDEVTTLGDFPKRGTRV